MPPPSFVRDGTGSGDDRLTARRHHVSPGYLATLGVPLLRGRDFASADVPGGQRVAIVSERLARLAWPAQEAVGQRLRVEGADLELRVIGVSGDVQHGGLQADDTPQADIYLSAFQSTFNNKQQFPYLRMPGTYSYVLALDLRLMQAAGGQLSPAAALEAAAIDFEEITIRLGRERQRESYRTSLGY